MGKYLVPLFLFRINKGHTECSASQIVRFCCVVLSGHELNVLGFWSGVWTKLTCNATCNRGLYLV